MLGKETEKKTMTEREALLLEIKEKEAALAAADMAVMEAQNLVRYRRSAAAVAMHSLSDAYRKLGEMDEEVYNA